MGHLPFTATVLLFLCACASGHVQDGGGKGVTLRVHPDSAVAGDSVELVLHNGSDVRIGYNLCTSALERRQGAAWGVVPSDRVCPMLQRILAPGAESGTWLDLPGELAPGVYRYRAIVERLGSGARDTVRTGALDVR